MSDILKCEYCPLQRRVILLKRELEQQISIDQKIADKIKQLESDNAALLERIELIYSRGEN